MTDRIRALLLAIAIALASSVLQGQTVSNARAAMTEQPHQLFVAAPDSEPVAWCSNVYVIGDNLVVIKEMHPTNQAFNPPCGRDAVILKRPSCWVHASEMSNWLIDKPPLVIIFCGQRYGIFVWPVEPRA